MAKSLEAIAAEMDDMADIFYQMAGSFVPKDEDPGKAAMEIFHSDGKPFDLRALAADIRAHARGDA